MIVEINDRDAAASIAADLVKRGLPFSFWTGEFRGAATCSIHVNSDEALHVIDQINKRGLSHRLVDEATLPSRD